MTQKFKAQGEEKQSQGSQTAPFGNLYCKLGAKGAYYTSKYLNYTEISSMVKEIALMVKFPKIGQKATLDLRRH